mmetsp:Transcript_1336/g.1124  ORF Transcript_1336/g.1124 Transcript_1336/m.1124 type:complete len:179 (-) Transcript_1336:263-799(-)
MANDSVSSTSAETGASAGCFLPLATRRDIVELSKGVTRDKQRFNDVHANWSEKFRASSTLWMRNKVEYFQGTPGSLGSYQYISGPPCRSSPESSSSSASSSSVDPRPDWRDNAFNRTQRQLKKEEESHAAEVKRKLQIENPQIVDYLRELEAEGGGRRKRRCRERRDERKERYGRRGC